MWEIYQALIPEDEIAYIKNISKILNSFIKDDFYILEIGTGSGLVSNKIIENTGIKQYYSYEPDRSLSNLRNHLVKMKNLIILREMVRILAIIKRFC